MDAPKTVAVTWVRQWQVSVTAAPGGQVDTPGGWVDDGAPFTVDALPAEKHRFAGWAGDVPGGQEADDPLAVTVGEPLSLVAAFERVNTPPEAGDPLPDAAVAAGLLLHIAIPADAFVDADGDPLTFAADSLAIRSLPAWLTFDPDTLTLSGTPSQDDAGTVRIAVEATDPAGAAAEQTFDLSVLRPDELAPGNTPPAAGTMWLVSQPGTTLSGTLNGYDADGDPLTFEIVDLPADGALVLADVHAGQFTYTPAAGGDGSDSFSYRVHDGQQQSDAALVRISIRGDTESVQLGPGWTLISVQTMRRVPARRLFAGRIWGWDGRAYFPVHADNAHAPWHIPRALVPGHGYWAFSHEGEVLDLE